MPDQPAYTVAVAALAAQIPAAVVLSPEDLSFYKTSIPAAAALADGGEIESVTVLDEVIRVASIGLPSAVAGKLTGYGPLRTRFFLDLAASLAVKVAELDGSHVEATGAGTAKATSLVTTRALRRTAIRVLKNLAGRRPEEKARLQNARKEDGEKADERVRSLESLAKELTEQMTKVPPTVAADAGATQALVNGLLAASGSVLDKRGSATDARTTVASLYDEMNELDGRLLHELRLFVGAMQDARKVDPKVPAVKSEVLKSGKRKKAPPVNAAAAKGAAAGGGAPAAGAPAAGGDVGNG